MSVTTVLAHVRAYADAVREQLVDLPPELVDDLTDGLEADLAAALEDGGTGAPDGSEGVDDAASVLDLRQRFGPVAAYAAELRAAAGIAPPGPPRRRPTARESVVERWEGLVRPVTSHRAWPTVVDVATQLRPTWWLVRGWVWFIGLLAAARLSIGGRSGSPWIADDLGEWVLLVLLVAFSVALGRGLAVPRWSRRPIRWVGIATAVLAVFVVPTFFVQLQALDRQPGYGAEGAAEAHWVDDGVYVEGQPVTNLFAFDADGEPLHGVQLFDEQGRQVTTVRDRWYEWWPEGLGESWVFLPAQERAGFGTRWNVFPLTGALYSDLDGEWGDQPRLRTGAVPRTPPPPFAKAPAVLQPGAPVDTDVLTD